MSCGDTALIEVSPTSSACGTGTGTATELQACPSEGAVSGAPGTARTPTAQTSFADPALTAASRPETDRSAGTSTACQAPVPVWWRMNGRPERSGAMSTPTAQKFVGLTAVTP